MQEENDTPEHVQDPGIISNPETKTETETEPEEDEEEEPPPSDGVESEITRSKCRALFEFRDRVEEAIHSNSLIVWESNMNDHNSKDIKLWGIPLLPSAGHKGLDTVLIKFLKAKRYKVHRAFDLLQQTLKWRADFGPSVFSRHEVDSLWFVDGRDKEGRPLFYTVLGKESRRRFINTYLDYFRWRVRCVERGIQSLDFSPGGVNSFIQIIDFKNAHVLAVGWAAVDCECSILVFGSQCVELEIHCAKRYATIENILVQYGGLKRENDTEFSTNDKVLKADVGANSTEESKIPAKVEITMTWDVTVVGFEVTYREEFIPDDECSYKVLQFMIPLFKHGGLYLNWPWACYVISKLPRILRKLMIQPKKFKLKPKSRALIHQIHKRTPSVYVDQLFIKPVHTVKKGLDPPFAALPGQAREEKAPLKTSVNSYQKVVQPESSSGNPCTAKDHSPISEADEMWESMVMNSPQMQGIDERAEEFIARFRAQMHHQEMMARRL